MNKSRDNLLGKIFWLIGVTLLLSAILTLIIYIVISNKIYINSRIAGLKSMGNSIVELISNEEQLSIDKIKNILDINMNFADTKIEVYDSSGNTYMVNYRNDVKFETSNKQSLLHSAIRENIKNKNAEEVLEEVLTGEEVVRETETYIFVGLPVFNSNNELIAAVVLTKPTPIMEYASNNSLYITLIVSTLGVFLIMLLPAYLIVRRIVKPLRQMTVVANAMSKGDFSKRADENIKGEVGELAKAINTCAKESEKLETTRRDYVANVSHELRTPIASMRVIGETLKDGLVKDEQTKQKYYDNIVKESIRLSNLVNDLLELSRLQSGSYVIEKSKMGIREIFESVNDIYNNIGNENIEFSVQKIEKDIEVFSNPEKIEQILIILIDNAFKHTTSGKISLNLEEQKDKIILSVLDTGCGIGENDIQHIFERFYKADKSHASEGSGLGLSIAKEILDVMGEKIWVESKLNEGSKFYFTIQKTSK